MAARWAGAKFAAVYASDLSRARVTAEAIARWHDLPVVGVPELREIHFGKWEGLTYDAILASWPKEIGQVYSGDGEARIPGGETFRQLQERAVGAIDRLVERHPGETIALVSHGGTIRVVIASALGLPLRFLWHIRQDHAAVSVIEYYPGFAMVCGLNDTQHLQQQFQPSPP